MKNINALAMDKNAVSSAALPATPEVFLVDDDPSVRRALARLIKHLRVIRYKPSHRRGSSSQTKAAASRERPALVLDIAPCQDSLARTCSENYKF